MMLLGTLYVWSLSEFVDTYVFADTIPPLLCNTHPSSSLQMVSVERVIAYTKLKPEAPLETPPGRDKPSGEWPQHGSISADQMKFRYAQDAPYILKGISVDIKPGEKVGCQK